MRARAMAAVVTAEGGGPAAVVAAEAGADGAGALGVAAAGGGTARVDVAVDVAMDVDVDVDVLCGGWRSAGRPVGHTFLFGYPWYKCTQELQ